MFLCLEQNILIEQERDGFIMIGKFVKIGEKLVDKADAGIRDGISAGYGMAQNSKLNKQIVELKDEITGLKVQIGDYYWKKHTNSEAIDEVSMHFCKRIDELTSELETLMEKAHKSE